MLKTFSDFGLCPKFEGFQEDFGPQFPSFMGFFCRWGVSCARNRIWHDALHQGLLIFGVVVLLLLLLPPVPS